MGGLFSTGGSFQPAGALAANEFKANWACSTEGCAGRPWLLVYGGGEITWLIGFNGATGFVLKFEINWVEFKFEILSEGINDLEFGTMGLRVSWLELKVEFE